MSDENERESRRGTRSARCEMRTRRRPRPGLHNQMEKATRLPRARRLTLKSAHGQPRASSLSRARGGALSLLTGRLCGLVFLVAVQ